MKDMKEDKQLRNCESARLITDLKSFKRRFGGGFVISQLKN